MHIKSGVLWLGPGVGVRLTPPPFLTEISKNLDFFFQLLCSLGWCGWMFDLSVCCGVSKVLVCLSVIWFIGAIRCRHTHTHKLTDTNAKVFLRCMEKYFYVPWFLRCMENSKILKFSQYESTSITKYRRKWFTHKTM